MKTNYPDLEFLVDISEDASRIMLRNFNLKRDWKLKKDSTPLTKADTLINAMVLARFKRDYPHINVIGEEGNREVADAEYTALVDPIDDTRAFSLGIPVSAVCLSVLRGDKPIAAVICDPFQRRMWIAYKGRGTFLNGESVHVSDHKELSGSNVMLVKWLGCGFNLNWVEEKLMESGTNVQNRTSLAYFGGLIASGIVEASIFPGQGLLETAAMQVIVEEAGGMVTDLSGNRIIYSRENEYRHKFGSLVSNKWLHEELLKLTNPPYIPE